MNLLVLAIVCGLWGMGCVLLIPRPSLGLAIGLAGGGLIGYIFSICGYTF